MTFISNTNTSGNDSEIDLIYISKFIWNKRRLIFIIIGSFILLGVLVAVLSKAEYTTNSTYIPQVSAESKNGRGLSGLASLAGINLVGNTSASEIPPSLYPRILNSIPFKKEMLKAPLKFKELDKVITYREYYENYYSPGYLTYIKKFTIGLPRLVITSLKGNKTEEISSEEEQGIVSISPEELQHFKRLEGQVSILFNERDGLLELSAILPEALASAQLAKYAEMLLHQKVIDFKIKNAKEQLAFTKERFQEKKMEFEDIQNRLAQYRDRNRNISSSVALNQLEELETEYNLAFSVYSELAKQLEQAKLQVSKDTPVFSVIQPVTVPAEKSGPKRLLIIVVFAILGFIIALVIIFSKELLDNIMRNLDA